MKWLFLLVIYTGFWITTGTGLILKADLDFIYISVMFAATAFLISAYSLFKWIQEAKKEKMKDEN